MLPSRTYREKKQPIKCYPRISGNCPLSNTLRPLLACHKLLDFCCIDAFCYSLAIEKHPLHTIHNMFSIKFRLKFELGLEFGLRLTFGLE